METQDFLRKDEIRTPDEEIDIRLVLAENLALHKKVSGLKEELSELKEQLAWLKKQCPRRRTLTADSRFTMSVNAAVC